MKEEESRFFSLPPSLFSSPSTLFSFTQFFADYPGTCLLYSGGVLDSVEETILGLFPYETIEVRALKLAYRCGKELEKKEVENPWDALQKYFFSSQAVHPDSIAFGWFGYGMSAFIDAKYPLPYHPSQLPDAYWQRCVVTFKLSMKTLKAEVRVNLSAFALIEEEEAKWATLLSSPEGWIAFIGQLPPLSVNVSAYSSYAKQNDFDRYCSLRKKNYVRQIEHIHQLIRAGDIYQVNLSHAFAFENHLHPFTLFFKLCKLNPAPFSLYFHHSEGTIVSTSPERFLNKKGEWLETRPIKGTIQRGKTLAEDQILKERLLESPKELSELLMITDLMRNDLGKISIPGSVEVAELFRCEAYTNVFHLLSIIRSKVLPIYTFIDIVRACFPGGSVTGCPKMKAIEVINQIEKRPRGIYTGSIGYFTGRGDFDLNIAIRTLVTYADEPRNYHLQLGGGIVIDSDAESEYRETLYKGDSIFRTFQIST